MRLSDLIAQQLRSVLSQVEEMQVLLAAIEVNAQVLLAVEDPTQPTPSDSDVVAAFRLAGTSALALEDAAQESFLALSIAAKGVQSIAEHGNIELEKEDPAPVCPPGTGTTLFMFEHHTTNGTHD